MRPSAPSARVEEAEAEAQKAGAGQGAPAVAKARKELVLGALNTLFDSSVEEEVRVRFSPNPSLTLTPRTRP